MVEYSKKLMDTKDGSKRYYYVKTLANGKSTRISLEEYNKHKKNMKGGVEFRLLLDVTASLAAPNNEQRFNVYLGLTKVHGPVSKEAATQWIKANPPETILERQALAKAEEQAKIAEKIRKREAAAKEYRDGLGENLFTEVK